MRSYRYTLSLLIFAPPENTGPVVVEVRNGVPEPVTPAISDVEINAAAFKAYDTMEELFAVVEKARARNPETMEETYDTRYGYPAAVSIDYDHRMADEEFGFRVTNFEPLP